MKDTYVFMVLSGACVYVLSVRKRRHEIKDNLISISNNMRVHQEERNMALSVAVARDEATLSATTLSAATLSAATLGAAPIPENTITPINLPTSNPPSPLLGTEILNTPTPRHKGEDVHELTFEDQQSQHMCICSLYVFTIFSTIVYLYCTSIPTDICLADLFGPEL
jgi:hypothetical protein